MNINIASIAKNHYLSFTDGPLCLLLKLQHVQSYWAPVIFTHTISRLDNAWKSSYFHSEQSHNLCKTEFIYDPPPNPYISHFCFLPTHSAPATDSSWLCLQYTFSHFNIWCLTHQFDSSSIRYLHDSIPPVCQSLLKYYLFNKVFLVSN